MEKAIIISQAEIDYMVSCMYRVQSDLREDLIKRIMSLPSGRKRLQIWGDY
tara:strand:- start:12 stop:164 length:153 start_codon:yes stop_codon:yes gene_type:complete